jgi:hypothetical protein
VANDPLEGIQIRIVQRAKAAAANTAIAIAAPAEIESQRSGIRAPSFGRYRDAEAPSSNGAPKGASKPLESAPKAVKRIKPAPAPSKADHGVRSAPRSQNRIS